jgi:hypothetical protein
MATVYHLRGTKGPAVSTRKCPAAQCENLNLRGRAAGYPTPRLGCVSLLEAQSRCADEPKPSEIKTVDEHVDRSHRVILSRIVIKRCRKQRALPTIQPFNKALHQMSPQIAGNLIARITANRAFSLSLGPSRKSRDVRFRAAVRGIADTNARSATGAVRCARGGFPRSHGLFNNGVETGCASLGDRPITSRISSNYHQSRRPHHGRHQFRFCPARRGS